MPYAGLFALLDRSLQRGRRYYMKGSGVKALSDEAIDALVAAGQAMTSPYSQIYMMPFHGAATRVGECDTAFAIREEHVEVLLTASWEPAAADKRSPAGEKHVQWARQTWQALQPFASQRAYVNFLDDEGSARGRAAYGPNYERLRHVKRMYDPENVFHLNQNIAP